MKKSLKSSHNTRGFFVSSSNAVLSNSWASSEGIFLTLQKELSNQVHIINPELGSIFCVFDSNTADEAASNILKTISGYEACDSKATNNFIHLDGGTLKKPILMILNTSKVFAVTNTDQNAEGGSHWVTCIIFPKYYKNLRNNNESIVLLDSLYPTRKIPQVLLNLLRNGGTITFSSAIAENSKEMKIWVHKMPAAFPNLDEINISEFKQQQVGESDCGWWAVHNAITVIKTGSIKTLMDNYTGPKSAIDLRNCYPDLDISSGALNKRGLPLRKCQKSNLYK